MRSNPDQMNHVQPQISGLTQRPTRIEISLSALQHNLEVVRSLTRARIMPVVKANAYGHGIVPIARWFEDAGVDALAVGFLEEGILLRESGVRLPILVLGGIPGEQFIDFIRHGLTPTISSHEKAEHAEAAAAAQNIMLPVHLKVDTGMQRVGVRPESALPLVRRVHQSPHLRLEGIYSHFACAHDPGNEFTDNQIRTFRELLAAVEREGIRVPQQHLANSGGVLYYPNSHLNLVRPGIMLFGYHPGQIIPTAPSLQPVLSLKSEVVYFKVVKAGKGISYGHQFSPSTSTRVVTVPIGYGDGYSRTLSGRARVLIRGHEFPVAGTICMDQLMVDLGQNGSAWTGDPTVLIGEDNNKKITARDLADQENTIHYEVLTRLNTRLPRVLVD